MWLLVIIVLHRYDVVTEVSVMKIETPFSTLMACEKMRDSVNKPNSLCVEERDETDHSRRHDNP